MEKVPEAILVALTPHKDQVKAQLEATLRVSALDNRGVLTSPRRAPDLARQICDLWFDFLAGAAGATDIEQLTAKLVEQGLAYVTAGRAMQALRESLLTLLDDNTEIRTTVLLVRNNFSESFLSTVSAAREVLLVREQEHYQASLQRTLQTQLQRERELAEKLQQRQRQLQAVIDIYAAVSGLNNETELLTQFVQQVQTHLKPAGVAIFELASTKDLTIVKTAAGQLPPTLKLNTAVSIESNNVLAQAVSLEKLVFKSLPDHTANLNHEIAMPLTIGGAVMGILVLWSAQTGFSEDDFEFVPPLAIILASTWQNIRLLAQAEDRTLELELLHGQRVRTTWQENRELSGQMHIFDGVGVRTEVMDALQSNQTLSDSLDRPTPTELPIFLRDLQIGALKLPVDQSHFSDEDAAFVEGVVREMTNALETANLIQDTQRRTHYEQILRRITASVNTGSDIFTILPEISQQLQQILPLDVLTLATYSTGEPEFTLYAVGAGARNQHFGHRALRLPIDGTCPGWVITHNDVWIDDDLTETKPFIEDEQLADEGMKSRLVLPLRLGDKVIGTLNLSAGQPGLFTGQYLYLLWQIADQIALALERSRLFDETQRHAHREQTIREITEKMQMAPNLEQLVAIATEELGKRLSASYAELELGLEPEHGTAPVVN